MFWRTPVYWFLGQVNKTNTKVNPHLHPHKKYPGYFIDAKKLVVYSIKSGTLKQLHMSTWNGEESYCLSHKGVKRYHYRKWLKSSIDMSPTNTVPLEIRKG